MWFTKCYVIGNVIKGSRFAVLQSIDATGYLFKCACHAIIYSIPILLAGVVILASIYYFCFYEGENSVAPLRKKIFTEISNANIGIKIADSFEDMEQSISNVNGTSIAENLEKFKYSLFSNASSMVLNRNMYNFQICFIMFLAFVSTL